MKLFALTEKKSNMNLIELHIEENSLSLFEYDTISQVLLKKITSKDGWILTKYDNWETELKSVISNIVNTEWKNIVSDYLLTIQYQLRLYLYSNEEFDKKKDIITCYV